MSLKEQPTRRRGAALEKAILDAAWSQLLNAGATDFTYEAVAARAGTSRPVIYRRWPQREQLLKAAIRHGGNTVRRTVPDTGNLRDDMVTLLYDMNRTADHFLALLTGHLEILHSSERMTPDELRDLYLADRPQRMRVVIDRAVERGEIDPARATDLVLGVPADLVRERIMRTQRRIARAEVEAIIDQVFLPLVRPLPSRPSRPR